MKIRKATIKDTKGLAELYVQFWEYHKDPTPLFECSVDTNLKNSIKDARLTIKDKKTNTYVAVENDKIIGYIAFSIVKNIAWFKIRRYCYVDECGVDNNWRGKGVAKELLECVIEYCKAKRINYLELKTLVGNELAENVWQNLDFKKEATVWFKKI